MLDSITAFLAGLVGNYPILMSIVFIVGALRVVMKPLVALLRAYVAYTPNAADDAALDAVEASSAWKTFLFVLDWVASIKPLS